MTTYKKDARGNIVTGPATPVRVAIIGSARARDGCISEATFSTLVRHVDNYIRRHFDVALCSITLVSGGSSWVDHVAVSLFLRGHYGGLQLHLPCEWDALRCQYVDNGAYSYTVNPGKTLNTYHKAFSRDAGIDSLKELDEAMCDPLFDSSLSKGFHARNVKVAQSVDFLLAITWDEGDTPVDGGTLHTWTKSNPPQGKVHMSVASMTTIRKRST